MESIPAVLGHRGTPGYKKNKYMHTHIYILCIYIRILFGRFGLTDWSEKLWVGRLQDG